MSIVKTNNITQVLFFDEGDYKSLITKDGWVYHATNSNIVINKIIGINELKERTSKVSYEVILRNK